MAPEEEQGGTAGASDQPGETTPLLPDQENSEERSSVYQTISHIADQDGLPFPAVTVESEATAAVPQTAGVYATLAILMLGVFVAQTDASLVLATYSEISSDFGEFELGPWLMSSSILAQCAAQPLYGKLSDIYGRKSCLQASYILFTIGTAWTAFGGTIGQVIAARAIQGAGGAGMVSMVSIIITDLVPIQDVATLRSYVNVLHTTGRSCGGVIGGFLTQTIGWRWAFGIQVPPIVIAIGLVQWQLRLPPMKGQVESTKWEKLKRIDFTGALFLTTLILSLCLIFDLGGQSVLWSSPLIKALVAVAVVSGIAFVINARHVKEPIFPLRLLGNSSVVTNYSVNILLLMAQLSMMMSVPLFFQATRKASTAAAGAYLIPAFAGNSLGGILTGLWIKRTGLFKLPTVIAPMMAILCFTLCYTTWTDDTSIWRALAIFPGGFGVAMASSSTFVGLAAGVDEADLAVAASGLYLCFNIGAIAGTSSGAAVYQTALKASLKRAVEGMEDGSQIISKALDSISFVQNASSTLRQVLVPAYVDGFHAVNLLGLCCAAVALVLAVFSRDGRIGKA